MPPAGAASFNGIGGFLGEAADDFLWATRGLLVTSASCSAARPCYAMLLAPCVSLTRLEPGVHTDAAVLFAVPRAHGVMPYKTICHAHPSQADGAPGISTISNTTQAARILLAAAAAAAPDVCLRISCCGSPWRRVAGVMRLQERLPEWRARPSEPRARLSKRRPDAGRLPARNVMAEERRDERAQLAADMYPRVSRVRAVPGGPAQLWACG